MFVSMVVIRGIFAELERRGFDGLEWLSKAGVDPVMLHDSRAYVELQAWDCLTKHAMKMVGDPALGLAMGLRDRGSVLHLLGYVLMSSRTLQDAFSLCQRYSALVASDLQTELVHLGPHAHLRFGFGFLGDADSQRFGEDLAAALVYRLVKHHVPEASLLYLRLRQPEPSYAERFCEAFGCTVTFGSQRSEMILERSIVLTPQHYRDDQLLQCLMSVADDLRRDPRPSSSVAERVRLVLAHESDPLSFEIRAIAAKLGMTLRQLRRRLRDEGTSLSALKDEWRMKSACAALSTPNTTVKVAAELVGYSEPSAFHRAFKRWTGTTPLKFKQVGDSHVGGELRSLTSAAAVGRAKPVLSRESLAC